MTKTYAILEKTKIGRYFRTTVPEEVRKIMDLEEGDEIIWVQDGKKILIDRARKEVK